MINKKLYVFCLLLLVLIINSCQPINLGVNEIEKSYNFPNPFSPTSGVVENKKTTIRTIFVNNNEVSKVDLTIKIEDVSGSFVWYFNREITISDTTPGSKTDLDVTWAGNNNEGDIVSQGIYKASITVKSIESTSGYGGDTLSSNIKIAVE